MGMPVLQRDSAEGRFPKNGLDGEMDLMHKSRSEDLGQV